ncbi:MAG: hypothetical protein JF589_15890 [Gemmatimonadetes bacterium]|jgi:hypothetical protein|nr:hypothetical protein [Gemmatimonadota bacterium]
MMRSIIRAAVSAGALVVLSACGGGDAGTGVRASVTGTYQLSTVNGQSLPFTESSSGAVVKITAGQLVAQSDGTFSETLTRATTPPGGATTTQSTTSSGTFTVGNQVIVFTYGGSAGTALGSLISNGISIQNGANAFEYKK